MKKSGVKTWLVALGMLGSVIAGVTLFIVGGIMSNFTLTIIGVVVLIVGVFVVSFCAIIPYIIEAARNFSKENPLSAKEAAALDEAMKKLGMINEPDAQNQTKEYDGKDVGALMDRENFLISELKRTDQLGLLNEYQTQVDALWNEYTGDDWDENLEAISELVDYYMQFVDNNN